MTPREIYQAFLDDVSSRLWDGDAVGVARRLKYPHTIHLPEADRVMTSAEEQMRDTQVFIDSLMTLKATAFHRLCRDARFDPGRGDRIVGIHTTYIIRGGSYLNDPYDCAMSLVLDGSQGWLADTIRVSIRNSRMAYYHPNPRQTPSFSVENRD